MNEELIRDPFEDGSDQALADLGMQELWEEEQKVIEREQKEQKGKDMDIMTRLSAPLPKEAVQRASKEQTRKGYDTTGLGYQFCINRFNEILGDKWGYTYEIIRESEGTFGSGQTNYNITVEVSIWIKDRNNIRKCVGGHVSSLYFDALKGAITNAFKKTAAFWGVGRQAYEGSLDDDTVLEEEVNGIKETKVIPQPSKPAPASASKPAPASASKPAPAATSPQPPKGDISWAQFWGVVKGELGLTSKEAHNYCNVVSFDTLIEQGQSRRQILEKLKTYAKSKKQANQSEENLLSDEDDKIIDEFIDLWEPGLKI